MTNKTKYTRAQRKALKAWRRDMRQQGYAQAEINAAINDGTAYADILANQAVKQTGEEIASTAADKFLQRRLSAIASTVAAHKQFCTHRADKTLFTINQSEICGGARWDCRYTSLNAALTIDLTGIDTDIPCKVSAGYETLMSHVAQAAPSIHLDWPDHGLPPVEFSFWPELVKLLPVGRVVMRCTGGHGRTGTALASLAVVGLGMTAQVAIDYVRKNHCASSIETRSQSDYVRRLHIWWTGGDPNAPLAVDAASAGTVRDMRDMLEADVGEDDYVGYECPNCNYSCGDAGAMAMHRQAIHGD